jgi:hypothetical protein
VTSPSSCADDGDVLLEQLVVAIHDVLDEVLEVPWMSYMDLSATMPASHRASPREAPCNMWRSAPTGDLVPS